MLKNNTIYILYLLFNTFLICGCIFFFELIDQQRLLLLIICILTINILSFLIFYYCANTFLQNPGSQKEQELIALKTAEKYRREFFGNVSHELKTPIFNIQGYVETLIGGALHDKSVNKKYLKRTSKSIDRLIYIIQDLETISQLESEELNLELTSWNLKSAINEIIDQFEIKSKQKRIKIIHNKKSTGLYVLADKGKIMQVLSNLISNSIKYGRRDGVTKISCHELKDVCWVSVKDNGIGITPKFKDHTGLIGLLLLKFDSVDLNGKKISR